MTKKITIITLDQAQKICDDSGLEDWEASMLIDDSIIKTEIDRVKLEGLIKEALEESN